jgi:hypothetical protein
MTTTPDPQSGATDPIDAELERALFKRFWTWLGIVGVFVMAAVTAISVLVSQYLIITAKETANKQIEHFETRLKDLQNFSIDSAAATVVAQKVTEKAATSSEALAKSAEDTITKSQTAAAAAQAASANAAAKAKDAVDALDALTNKLKSTNALLSTENLQSLADALASKPEFARVVSNTITQRLEFTIVRTAFEVQQATLSCPSGSHLVSASCIGNNGSPQAAVGPEFHDNGSVSCYRYGAVVMPVQATAICFKVR